MAGTSFRSVSSHYGEKYFISQSSAGELGAKLGRMSFEKFVTNGDTVHEQRGLSQRSCHGLAIDRIRALTPLGNHT